MTKANEGIAGSGSTTTAEAIQVRRFAYESEAAAPAGPAQCPQCGHMIETTRAVSVAPVVEPEPVQDLPQDLRVRVGVERAVMLVLEVIDGRRADSQFAASMVLPVRRYLRATAALYRNPRRSTLRSVRVCQPADGVAEVAAVCEIGGRPLALAARLESVQGATVWTSLRLLA